MKLSLALLSAAALLLPIAMPPAMGQTADKDCQNIPLANQQDKLDLASRIMSFGGAAIIVGLAERKPQVLIATGLVATSAAIDIFTKLMSGGEKAAPGTEVRGCTDKATKRLEITEILPRPPAPAPAHPMPLLLSPKAAQMEIDSFSKSDIAALMKDRTLVPVSPPAGQRAAYFDASKLDLKAFRSLTTGLPLLSASIKGRVIEQATAAPIANAAVKLTSPASLGGLERAVVTAADGSFAFDLLAKGDYVLSVRHDGFSSASRTIALAEREGASGQDVALNNIRYPCAFTLKNGTGTSLAVEFENDPRRHLTILPSAVETIQGLDRPQRISAKAWVAPQFSAIVTPGPTWAPFRIECGGSNSVRFVPG